MSASFESILVSVWQQSLIDKKKTVDLDGATYPSAKLPRANSNRSISVLKTETCGDWNRIRIPNLGGRNWPEKVNRSCSFWSTGNTLRSLWTEKFTTISRSVWFRDTPAPRRGALTNPDGTFTVPRRVMLAIFSYDSLLKLQNRNQ